MVTSSRARQHSQTEHHTARKHENILTTIKRQESDGDEKWLHYTSDNCAILWHFVGEIMEREVEEKVTDSRKDRVSTIKAQLWASLNYEPLLRTEFEMPPLHFYSITGNIKKKTFGRRKKVLGNEAGMKNNGAGTV